MAVNQIIKETKLKTKVLKFTNLLENFHNSNGSQILVSDDG